MAMQSRIMHTQSRLALPPLMEFRASQVWVQLDNSEARILKPDPEIDSGLSFPVPFYIRTSYPGSN